MKITKKKLKELKACCSGIRYFENEKLEGKTLTEVVYRCLETDNFSHANWLVTKLMSVKQRRMYAIFAAEQVIDIFENKYPNDNRPRKAIEDAKAVVESDTEANRNAASDAAYAATYAASSAAYAADAASDAAYAAAYAAYAAAYAADAAAYAAYAAADAADAADAAIKESIINYGLELLGE